METTAIQPYQRFKEVLLKDEVQGQFESVLGKRSQAFIASLMTAVKADNNLQECPPAEIIAAAMKAAVLDLVVEPALGWAWIIPYKSHGVTHARFQIGYKGLIQLALRSGQYETLNATPIYEGEEVTEDRITGKISLSGKPTSNEVKGFVCYLRLKGGYEHYLYMTADEIRKHAERYSQSYSYKDSAWQTNFIEMGLKTVIKQAISKYGVMSISMNYALESNGDEDSEEIEATREAYLEGRIPIEAETPQALPGQMQSEKQS